jgi:hypothetical protein
MSRAFLKRNDTSAPLGLLGVENDNDAWRADNIRRRLWWRPHVWTTWLMFTM